LAALAWGLEWLLTHYEDDSSMNHRLFFAVAAVLTLAACNDAPTSNTDGSSNPSFITHGTVDGNAHPAVVLLVMDVDGVPTFACSGTLIAPTFVLTAGHCAGEPGEFSAIRIFTESDVSGGNNNFPFDGPNSIPATAWAAHPLFSGATFFLHDVGMVKLASPVNLPSNEYGTLPEVNQLNGLKPSSHTLFTVVGYGLQRFNPAHLVGRFIREFATPHLVQINKPNTGTFSLLLSTNASSGGQCRGDSGGPVYLGSSNVIAGVTSFGRNRNTCSALAGTFRLDRPDVLSFINGFIAAH
jgi:V8-like Glu-specific endopeptidase